MNPNGQDGHLHGDTKKAEIASQRRNQKKTQRLKAKRQHDRQMEEEALANMPEDEKVARAEAAEKEEREMPDTYKNQVKQARRWVNNEFRKADRGGLGKDASADFQQWTSSPEIFFNAEDAWMVGRGRAARQRFEVERKAARQEQGRNKGLEDWWGVAPPSQRGFRPRPGSQFTSWLEDGQEIACVILPGCLPSGWVPLPDEEQRRIMTYLPVHYFLGLSGKVLRVNEKEEENEMEDGGVALPGPSVQAAGNERLNEGVALPVRLNNDVEEEIRLCEQRLMALTIRHESGQE
ncbi:MAG: hypothetical protein Q9218_007021 [Villophora microphyllina]